MLLEKILARLREEGEKDMKEFRRSLLFLRLDNNDIDMIIKDMVESGMVSINNRGKKGNTISMKRSTK